MSGPYEDEIMRLRLLSAAHPNVRILTHLAEAYRKAGDLVRARETVERGIARHAEYPNAHVVLGRVLWEMGDRQGAERAFRRALELDPENRIAREWLAHLPATGALNPANTAPGSEAPASTAPTSPAQAAATSPPGPSSPPPPPPAGHTGLAQGADPGSNGGSGNGRKAAAFGPGPAGPRRLLVADYHDPGPRGVHATRRPAAPPAPLPASPAPPPPTPPSRTSQTAASSPIRAYLDKLLAFRPAHAIAAETTGDARSDADTASADAAIDIVALTDLLVRLLESRDPERHGQSSLTRLIATAIGREFGMNPRALDELALAALLRDLGRLAHADPTVEETHDGPVSEERRRIAARAELTLKLLDSIALPAGVPAAIRHQHERWDGDGYPDRLAGAAIPLAARILAVADSLAAKISPPPDRPLRGLAAAVAEIQSDAGKRFDPAVVDALIRTLPHRLRRRAVGLGLRHHVIVVDADRSRAAAIATPLGNRGFLAQTVADPKDALDRMRRCPADVLVVAADLPGGATVELLEAVRADVACAGVAIVAIYADTVERRIELLERGADVCLASGVACDELRAAIRALLKRHAFAVEHATESVPARAHELVPGQAHDSQVGRVQRPEPGRVGDPAPVQAHDTVRDRAQEPVPDRAHGPMPGWAHDPVPDRDDAPKLPFALRGDLAEFPLAWLLQALHFDSRTAAIVVRGGELQGTVYVENGTPVHAHTAETDGDQALRSMLQWEKGTFDVIPDIRPPVRSVQRPVMHLLLESAVEADLIDGVLGAVRSGE